jgi:DNA repair protein RecO (recombination protein O)
MTERAKAIVLRRTNYGEADRVVQLLTPLGRRSVMARGVRREKSKLAGGIELFAICDVVINKGKGELGVLTQARTEQFFRHILEDYDRLQFAYEVLKLVARASETVDEPEWFDVTSEVLEALDQRTSRQLVATWFYLRYSALLGYELSLQRDINGEALSAEKAYMYDIAEKGLREAANGDVTADHIKFLRLTQVKPLKIIAQIGGVEAILPTCWQVVRDHAAV